MLQLNTDRSSSLSWGGAPSYSETADAGAPAPERSLNDSLAEVLGEYLKGPSQKKPEEAETTVLGSLLGKAWNGVNTAVGLAWGLAGVPFGARPSFDNNAIQFENHPFMDRHGAITLGNVIAYGEDAPPDARLRPGSPYTIGDHERQHTYQGQLLGPLYLPSNILGGLAGVVTEGSWHGAANWNESGPQKTPPRAW